jgi:hypothetical protein
MHLSGTHSYQGESTLLPGRVKEWMGDGKTRGDVYLKISGRLLNFLVDYIPEYPPDACIETTLSKLNDSGVPFCTIAWLILNYK